MTSSETKAVCVPEKKRAGVILRHSYGKSKVRLTKVSRHADRHDLKELCVDISLEGDFAETYTTGENTRIVATDSMKNTVYVLAAEHPVQSIESFALDLAKHFLNTYKHVEKATVDIAEELWQRIVVNGKAHPHAFAGAGAEKRTVCVEHSRTATVVQSGIADLRVVKTTDSAFEGFIRDKYTTLPEVKDRMFGTSISGTWLYKPSASDYNRDYETVRDTVLEVFATHISLSVQQTLHEIGQEVLARCSDIIEISLVMPNEHRIPFILHQFGLENRNEISVTTDEPHGLIKATIARCSE
ncbi:MAG TPA: urate oxidase [Oculatellaceae cyanobacterium]